MTLDLRYSSSYQGMESGTGSAESDYEYGGKADAFVNLDFGKMGLWSGGGLRSHVEYGHGDAPPNLGGALFSVNTAQLWPIGANEEVVATSLYFTQKVGARVDILLGKVNPIDLLATDPFFGGWGTDRFMNLIFAAPPSGVVPPVFIGVVTAIKATPVSWTIMIFDPDDRTNDYFPGDLFENGVNFSVTGAHAAKLTGRKTTYAVTTNYSTAESVDFSALPPDIGTSTKSGAYSVAFQFTHNIRESSQNPGAACAFYFKGAIADGNPNYVQNSVIAGIAGRALFLGRPQDGFGLGAFYYDLSDELQDSAIASVDIQDESGVEAYYNFAVTPWLFVGADVQLVNPARGKNDSALVAGLRTQVRF